MREDKYLLDDNRKSIACCIYDLRFDMDCLTSDDLSIAGIMAMSDDDIINFLMELLTELKESR